MKKTTLALAAGAMALTGLSVPAAADPPHWAPAHGYRDKHRAREYRPTYYRSPEGVRYWQAEDGRYRCRRSDGTTGLIIGAAGGALLGRAIDTHGERATGTILGAAAGALLGRQIDRGSVRCR